NRDERDKGSKDEHEKGSKDEGGSKSDYDKGSKSDYDKGSKDEHDKGEKPRGGVHAGGGGLAESGTMAAGSVLLLGGLGAGAYMLRRRSASGPSSI
ncbi:hypothetical protein ABZZ38_06975, partial [Streptomyces sp. NPDC006368]